MSLVHINQLIEKERQKHLPKGFWKNEENSEHDYNDSTVFDNCLTGVIKSISGIYSNKTALNDASKKEDNNSLDIEEDTDNSKIGNQFSVDVNKLSYDRDETDYFDSEDEYWESITEKEMENVFCPRCQMHHPTLNLKEQRQSISCKKIHFYFHLWLIINGFNIILSENIQSIYPLILTTNFI